MTKDDQRVRETVQAELRRRRGAQDRSDECSERGNRGNGHAVGHEDHDRRLHRQWSLPSGTGGG